MVESEKQGAASLILSLDDSHLPGRSLGVSGCGGWGKGKLLLRVGVSGHSKEALPAPTAQGIV